MQPFSCILSPVMDAVFKALADESRRSLLDQLRKCNGQTLGELCAHLDMTRQAVTKHLGLLEKANLIAVVWHGREKLHYLNPVPLQEIHERWIGKFERPRLQALSDLKKGLEQNNQKKTEKENAMNKPQLVYTTYIRSTPERVWEAITKPEFTRQYWGEMANVSDWKEGSTWEHHNLEQQVRVTGKVQECVPPTRLVLSWIDPADLNDESRVTFSIEATKEIVCLTVTHDSFKEGSKMSDMVSQGWPLVLSSLKSYLETGNAIDIWQVKSPCKQS